LPPIAQAESEHAVRQKGYVPGVDGKERVSQLKNVGEFLELKP